MSRVKKRSLPVLLALMLAITMMPLAGAGEVYAASYPSMISGKNGAALDGINGAQESSIYFGNYPQSSDGAGGYRNEPIKWRVLHAGEQNDCSGKDPVKYNGVFLLADKCLDSKPYHTESQTACWETCSLRTWLNGSFLDTAFSGTEEAAVATAEVKNDPNPQYATPGGNDTKDKAFLLSANEVTNPDYGFSSYYEKTPTREALLTDYAGKYWASFNGRGHWWLRTPGRDDDSGIRYKNGLIVGDDGGMNLWGVSIYADCYVVRPALNLNLKATIFKSAAVGGKSSGDVGPGALTQVGKDSTGEWKLTLKDSAHDGFDPSGEAICCSQNLYNINYKGAVKGDNEFISAIITDKKITDPTAKIKYYGRLKNIRTDEDTSGTVRIDVKGMMDSEAYLYLFNEQYNGDMETDYSSDLNRITQFETVPKDHLLTEVPAKPAACTKEGNDAYWTCPLCDKYFSDALGENEIKEGSWIIHPSGHKWDHGKVTRAATTTATGIKTYTCTVCKAKRTEKIKKLNPLAVKGKTATVKYSKVKKKEQTLEVSKLITFKQKGMGKMSYWKASGNKKIIINDTTGTVTVKKGLKKGTYKVKIKVTAAGNNDYQPSGVKDVTFKIKVK